MSRTLAYFAQMVSVRPCKTYDRPARLTAHAKGELPPARAHKRANVKRTAPTAQTTRTGAK